MNIRIIPPILLVLGSFVFIFFAVNQTANKTSTSLKAATSSRITIEGKIEKYTSCLSEYICHFIVDHGIKYNLDGAKYPNISESFPDLDSVLGKSVQVTGIWLDGKNPYLVIINITSL